MVENPVLFITFCRPEYARRSWEAIKRAQPRTLYFYSNKAREDRPDEVKRNEEVRAFVKEIDWECNLKKFFREEYVDIYTSLWGAMDWLFTNEETGIVLEEDCVASEIFFTYCDNMLKLHKDNKRISIISSNNRTPQFNPKNEDSFLTKFVGIYGWATWSDRWKRLDKNMKNWPKYRSKMIRYFGFWAGCWYLMWWQRMYMKIDVFNPWDSIFAYNNVIYDAYALVPVCNLVEDIGKYGTHHTMNETKANKQFTSKIGNPGNIYNNPQVHKLEICLEYEKGHFNAIVQRDLNYAVKKIFSKIKHK